MTLYERHAMTWDKTAKIGAFVTPKGTRWWPTSSRSVIQPYVDAYPNLHQTLVYARAVYAALGVYGLTYIIDPTSPYQEFSENAARVDYLQYPAIRWHGKAATATTSRSCSRRPWRT